MHTTMSGASAPESTPPRSRIRQRRGPRAVVAAVLAAVAALATVAVVEAMPASASTTNGVATIADPATLAYVASGASTTPFSATLPANASCSGDTASAGYHVFSYLVPEGTAVSSVTFTEFPSTGYGFVNNIGTYYGAANTAATTGQVISIPNNFQWAPLVSHDGVALSQLLTSGTTPGVWEGGIACANSSGVLTDNWNTEITFTASSSDPTGFVWSAVPGPSGDKVSAITSAASTKFVEGSSNTFTPTATGTPAPVITETGALPSGVSFTGGALTGTPTVTGSFPITLTATNGIGNPATQSFTLTVGVPPAITSANSTSFTEGTAGSFTPTATGTPTPSITESGALPSGVSFTGGALTGTPTVTGSFPITFTAANGIGSNATQSFTLTVNSAPAFTSATSTAFTDGSAGTFTPAATGSPTPTITESGTLPSGVTFSGGVLSGTPTVTGSFPITFTAANGVSPNATQSFTLTVNPQPGFHISTTSIPDPVVGVAYNVQLQTSGAGSGTVVWKKTTLPKGIALSSTGLLSGTPTSKGAGPATVAVTASLNKGTPVTASYSVNVDEAPAFSTKAATAVSFNEGTSSTFTVTATGNPAPTITEAGALPSGVTFSNGVLSGTPAITTNSATFTLTLTASNGISPAATESFTLTDLAPLVITTTTIPSGSPGTSYGPVTLGVTGGEGAYTWKKGGSLPKGLVLSSTGQLSGTLSAKLAPGSYSVPVEVGVKEGKTKVVTTKALTLQVVAP
jgi:large repetitive protein